MGLPLIVTAAVAELVSVRRVPHRIGLYPEPAAVWSGRVHRSAACDCGSVGRSRHGVRSAR